MFKLNKCEIQMVVNEVLAMSGNRRMHAKRDDYLKEIRDRNARNAYVRQEGIEIGMGKGIELEKAKSISTMLKKGKSVQEIAELLDIEEAAIYKVKDQ